MFRKYKYKTRKQNRDDEYIRHLHEVIHELEEENKAMAQQLQHDEEMLEAADAFIDSYKENLKEINQLRSMYNSEIANMRKVIAETTRDARNNMEYIRKNAHIKEE